MITITNGSYRLMVQPDGERITVSVDDGGSGHAVKLDREQARTLHTDLGEMLGRFEITASEP